MIWPVLRAGRSGRMVIARLMTLRPYEGEVLRQKSKCSLRSPSGVARTRGRVRATPGRGARRSKGGDVRQEDGKVAASGENDPHPGPLSGGEDRDTNQGLCHPP